MIDPIVVYTLLALLVLGKLIDCVIKIVKLRNDIAEWKVYYHLSRLWKEQPQLFVAVLAHMNHREQ